MKRLTAFFRSDWAFYVPLTIFILAATWIALSSIFPMAFDEEFHYGLIRIYATSWLPYGIQHTSDMAQYGAATADPSYLFHYLMSFPYRLLHFIGLSDTANVIVLRLMNLGFVVAGLFVFRRAMLKAKISRSVVNLGMWLLTLIPVFIMLAAQINYDNLLFLIVAWSIALIVDMTDRVRATGGIPLRSAWLLVIVALFGISIKYAYLPIALVLFIWAIGLIVISLRRNSSFGAFIKHFHKQTAALSVGALSSLVLLTLLGLFFASHYLVNHSTYGHAIPTCEQVFSEDECSAYGPWSRNRMYATLRSASFTPLSFPEYMAKEWVPGMAQRLTFSVAGKTNDFDTKMPLPAVVYSYVALTAVGLVCFIIQAFKRRITWFGWLTVLLSGVYIGVLSIQLYGDYVATAQPVAINGRYLIVLLPLIGIVLLEAISKTLSNIPSTYKAAAGLIALAVLFVAGAGVTTYILQSAPHWFWPGFGQTSREIFKTILNPITLPFRF